MGRRLGSCAGRRRGPASRPLTRLRSARRLRSGGRRGGGLRRGADATTALNRYAACGRDTAARSGNPRPCRRSATVAPPETVVEVLARQPRSDPRVRDRCCRRDQEDEDEFDLADASEHPDEQQEDNGDGDERHNRVQDCQRLAPHRRLACQVDQQQDEHSESHHDPQQSPCSRHLAHSCVVVLRVVVVEAYSFGVAATTAVGCAGCKVA